MVLIGCRPPGRLIEQHDIFFGIAETLKDLVPQIKASWPEAKGQVHIDCWREVTQVGNYSIHVIPKSEKNRSKNQPHLFFINLGGYKPGDFEEYHYKILAVSKDSVEAIKQSKQSAFFKHTSVKEKGGASHIDDKYGIDMDDIFKIEDVLESSLKERYALQILPSGGEEDELQIGYVQIKKLLGP